MDRWTQECIRKGQTQFGIASQIYMASADPDVFIQSGWSSPFFRLSAQSLQIIYSIRDKAWLSIWIICKPYACAVHSSE